GDNGLLPVLGPDGLVAWKEYARPYSGPEDVPRIAILITDIGLNTKSSNAAIDDLPGQVDLAFSPYGRNLQDWMDKARAKGHEGILMLPAEPLNYPDNDPGPHSLLTNLSETDNLKRLDWLLSQVAGYVGVVNHMGSKFTASEEGMMPILNDLNNRGMLFIDSRSTRFSMAARLARQINMPRAMNDRFIDNVISPAEIKRQLAELEKTARTFGTALGLARATPLTIREIAAWADTLDKNGIQLVPITAIANRQPIK
ncbi:MAG TPA: divergent polysaccharide deacetylase family protein, partial [Emcibacteraceae bacterium]|nr:divergent polysaccharide deacetylase family protein [Emcibacteraceae bacterium]